MNRKSGTFLRIFILVVVLLAAFFGLRYYYLNREVVRYEAPLTPVRVVKAERSDIEQSIRITGFIESEKMVPLVPFVSGTITEYDIVDGERVEKDQILARIDSEPYRLQVLQAEAQSSALESAYERMEKLYQSNAVTRQEYEGILAQRDAAQAQLELANLQLSYADVKAPASGTVVMSKGSVGSVASNTDYLAIIADMDNLIVNLSVSASYYDIIMDNLENLEITVTDNERNISSSASVVSVAPYIDPLSRSFNLRIKLDDPLSFTLGSAVSVRLVYQRVGNVLTLPSSVLRLDGSLYYVEDGHARYMEYTPLYENDELISAPAGMDDALFVIEGQNNLFDAQSVRVLEDSCENI